MAKRLLMDVIVEPCGCNLQLWVDGQELHAAAQCDSCREMVTKIVLRVFPSARVSIED